MVNDIHKNLKTSKVNGTTYNKCEVITTTVENATHFVEFGGANFTTDKQFKEAQSASKLSK